MRGMASTAARNASPSSVFMSACTAWARMNSLLASSVAPLARNGIAFAGTLSACASWRASAGMTEGSIPASESNLFTASPGLRRCRANSTPMNAASAPPALLSAATRTSPMRLEED
jgi:hypothetical protein